MIETLLGKIAVAIASLMFAIGGFFAPIPPPPILESTLGANQVNFVGGKPYYLYAGGIGTSDTSITLTAFKTPVSNYNLIMTNFGDIGYLTIEPGSSTRQEFISFTGLTQNSDGTATISGVTRGLSVVSPYTASTTLQKAHPGGSVVVISNPPQLYSEAAFKGNNEAITGLWTFNTSLPTSSVSPTTASQLVTKSYVDGGLLAGGATSTETVTGVSRLATKLQQASSTPSTANTPLVIQAQNATSTYNGGAAGGNGLNVVVTQNNNTIDSNFIATTSLYNWTGNHSWTASTTFSNATTSLMATTTIAAATSTAPLLLNTVSYAFPSTRGATSTVWTNDGIGNVLMMSPGYVLLNSTTTATSYATSTLSFGANTHLKIFIYGSAASAVVGPTLTFNSDKASNYGYSVQEDFSGSIAIHKSSAQVQLNLGGNSISTTSPFMAVIDVINISGQRKQLTWTGNYHSGTNVYPTTVLGTGVWNNTSSQINSITVWTGSASINFNSGMRVDVYGSPY